MTDRDNATRGDLSKVYADSRARTDALDEKLGARPATEPSFAVRDQAGGVLVSVTRDDIHHPVIRGLSARADAAEPAARAVREGFSDGAFAIGDEVGHLAFSGDALELRHAHIRRIDGRLAALEAGGGGSGDGWRSAATLAELLHFMSLGQSLSTGYRSTPVLSSAALTGAYRFVGGVRPQEGTTTSANDESDDAANYASLVGLNEVLTPHDGLRGETPCYGLAQMLKQLLADEDGIDLEAGTELLLSAPGQGWSTVQELSSGFRWDRIPRNISNGSARAGDGGKSYALSGIAWTQGENDYLGGTARAAYRQSVIAYLAQVRAAAFAATGVDRPIPMLLAQTATHLDAGRATPTIALAQLDLASEEMIGFATPLYFMAQADDLHITNASSKWLGAYYGLGFKRWLFDGEKPRPLTIESAQAYGSIAIAHLPSAVGGLTLDVTTVPAQPQNGFTVVDSGGANVPVALELISRDRIKFTAAVPLAGCTLRYAWAGSATKGLGNVRDNAGASLIFDPAGINQPMHRWLPICEVPFE
ncbi:hypothetical protein GCM10008171_33130 [Methylopila jiangsuensis]|uniref:Sialate O-acetylesterase domain-containing protein n=1 Tax=Methylopila jiangsuensis TaxID=586230 RepID=A0A9W6JKZ5_9HYPH|nr:hypothetical protein [Methylopila jiangsuensis]MDR6284553.1 hypothetical protein [Methylopila jiangsuensis]GLK78059.1 hypothetical protein GCM10008171_33130 [Methylopila jiangsuensis]